MASSSRPPPGAWNAHKGQRILTEAQRERKRERDRITKREEKARLQQRLQQLEQTKDSASKRIEELESQVNSLKKLCAGHNLRSDGLVAGESSPPPSVDVLNSSSISKCVPIGPLPLQSRGNPISVKQQETVSMFGTMGSHIANHYELPYTQANSPSVNTNYFSAVPQPSCILTSSAENYHRPSNDIPSPSVNGRHPYHGASTPQSATLSHPPTPAPSITIPSIRNLIEVPTPHSRNVSVINQFLDPQGFDITNDFNTLALSRKYLRDHPGIVTDPVVAEDFIIRAVLGGWERAFREHRGPTCPIWSILQLADEYMWNNTPHPVRFAYLLQHHRLFLYFLVGKEIPKWLVPRESQRIYAHEPIIAFNSQ
ncbi:hypothetical protein BGZ60DRAFT_140381 [Tricladium varicosporioides]|nr:hypothetical protein BGZ60DRAFT_140381 [Hymenoscyphus varicosporioides]